MTENKTQPTGQPVPDFLAGVADPQRRADCETVVRMMKQASGRDPVMWGTSIVGFGMYRYVYESGRSGDWPVIGFSPRKNDLTLYIMPGFARYEELLAKLGKHKTGRSCLYLKRLSDVDLPTLQLLMDESVTAMAPKRVD